MILYIINNFINFKLWRLLDFAQDDKIDSSTALRMTRLKSKVTP